jgi:hypothetical protein
MSDTPQNENNQTTQTETQTQQVEQATTASTAGEVFSEEKPAEAEAPFAEDKLTLPEGFEKGENFKEFTDIVTGLPHAKAQALVELHAKYVDAAVNKLTQAWESQQVEWQTAVKNDPEIGGAKLEGVKQTIAKVLDNTEFTDPEFRKAIISTGAGNHPAVIRTMYRMAKALTEGGSVAGGAPNREKDGSTSGQQPSIAEAMYGPNGPHSGGPKLS